MLTPEQQAVVEASMAPLCVVACAGSGKTVTAVRRLVQMRRTLGDGRGRLALLSFSNVAVDTFRKDYELLARELPREAGRDRVDIDTLDGFLTRCVLRAHGHRTMGSGQAPYLVTGSESFLQGFTFATATYPRPITELKLSIVSGEARYHYITNERVNPVDAGSALRLIEKLGRCGAYTHDLGRYWAYRALQEQPKLLAVLARRYPHILVDEAQDIGSVHQAILELLIDAGSCVTLIGDPNQGIYDFAGADGSFLRGYSQFPGVLSYSLTRNFRSVPPIVRLSNELCARNDVAERDLRATSHGAFFVGYKGSEKAELMTAFRSAATDAGADLKRSAVLCRGRAEAQRLRGDESPVGQGTTKLFAEAAVLRDGNNEYHEAFQKVAIAVVGLLVTPPPALVGQITQPARYPELKALRRDLWSFTRDTATGLPSAALVADSHWHPQLVLRTKALLAILQANYDLKPGDNVGRKLAKTGLPNVALWSSKNLPAHDVVPLRVDTVHQAKGETLDAVMYVTHKDHAVALLDGVETEVGRIGYVALTRARDLLWLAIPRNALQDLRPRLLARGFQELAVADVTKLAR